MPLDPTLSKSETLARDSLYDKSGETMERILLIMSRGFSYTTSDPFILFTLKGKKKLFVVSISVMTLFLLFNDARNINNSDASVAVTWELQESDAPRFITSLSMSKREGSSPPNRSPLRQFKGLPFALSPLLSAPSVCWQADRKTKNMMQLNARITVISSQKDILSPNAAVCQSAYIIVTGTAISQLPANLCVTAIPNCSMKSRTSTTA